MGQRAWLDALRQAQKWEDLLHRALGVFTRTGIVDLRLPEQGAFSGVGDLLLYDLDELEAISDEKGGIKALLDGKWRKVYTSAAPCGLFTKGKMRIA